MAIGELTAIGSGPNKKFAKKNAAYNLLMIIEKKSDKSEKDDNTVSIFFLSSFRTRLQFFF